MSMRTRLAIAIASVLLVTLLLMGVAVVRTTRAQLIRQVDTQLTTYQDQIQKDGAFRDNRPGPQDKPSPDAEERAYAYLVFSPDGTLVEDKLAGYSENPLSPPQLPAFSTTQLSTLIERTHTRRSVDGTLSYRVRFERAPNGFIHVMAAPLDEVAEEIRQLIQSFAIASAIALVTAIGVCWFLIRHELRPVDRMVDTAAAIAAGDLSRRIPNPDPATELGRLGSALNTMLIQIERADTARDASEQRLRRFVADAAHELRTPLTSLRGYAELFRQGALPDDAAVSNAMRRIESEGARMARLVDELLLLARLDQSQGVERAPVDLVPLVRDATEDFRVVDPDRPLTATFADSAVILGDALRLRQVIDNLLANVRTHTPANAAVRVEVTTTPASASIVVADTGPGITAEDRERLFERFWRADPARTRSRGGSGLGLAIVASLVEAQGETIDVQSEPGAGATFTVTFPSAPAPTGTVRQRR